MLYRGLILKRARGSFAGVGSELARSSLGLGHSSSLPVEEAWASSGMGFRATESLKGSFVGAGSELARGGPQLRGLRVGVGIRCLEGFGTVVL